MEQHNINIWNIPFYFFIFLGIFISFKFVFIFFFRAAFDPRFIFELTPFYILSGMNNLQLIFLSLIVVASNTYLHINITRKNLTRSFIPTIVMLSGLGIGITTKDISVSNLPQYLVFGLLLFILVIDHRRTLIFSETLPDEKSPKPQTFIQKIPLPFFGRSKPQSSSQTGISKTFPSGLSSVLGFFKRGKTVIKPNGVSLLSISSVLGLFKRGKKTNRDIPSKVEGGKQEESPDKALTQEKTIKQIPDSTIKGQSEKSNELIKKSGSIDSKEEDEMSPEIEKWIKEQEIIKKEQNIIIKDLQSNFEEIQKGVAAIKIELENITKQQKSSEQKSEILKEKGEIGGIERKIRPSSTVTYHKKLSETSIGQRSPEYFKRKASEKRKKEVLKAQTILENLEKKIEKLEHTYIR